MLTYREALRAFADGKRLEFFDGDVWQVPDFITSGPHGSDLDSPSPYRIWQATITINGLEVPEPLREAPRDGAEVFIPMVASDAFTASSKWTSISADLRLLKRGLVHLTREAAEAHARALILASGGQV